MHSALTVPLEAHYRYGFDFCPTHRIIEALGRVSFGFPFGITPDHMPFMDVGDLRIAETLPVKAVRGLAATEITTKEGYRKACRAFGTMFPPVYGMEVKRS